MFDIGWSEIGVIVFVALILLGPKEIPNAMKQLAYFLRKAKQITSEFQTSFQRILHEAELDETQKEINSLIQQKDKDQKDLVFLDPADFNDEEEKDNHVPHIQSEYSPPSLNTDTDKKKEN
ncbi:MAG: Sec-independent protein translocase protein TatB [Alphaproteobacteria bacterium]|nr:Sec-independent protein translocase protein TatB [Alphaproteobacteria bacterium]